MTKADSAASRFAKMAKAIMAAECPHCGRQKWVELFGIPKALVCPCGWGVSWVVMVQAETVAEAFLGMSFFPGVTPEGLAMLDAIRGGEEAAHE